MSKIAKSMAVLGVVAGLGVAALPLSSYAVGSNPVTIQATVDSSIAVTAATDMVDLGTIAAGTGIATQTTTVTVSGSVAKYDLGIIDKNDDNNMNWISLAEGQTANEDATATGDAIPAAANLEAADKGWAFRLGEDGDWTAVPVSTGTAAPIVEGGDLAGTAAKSNITFGVKADATLKNGIYQDQVVFVATPAN